MDSISYTNFAIDTIKWGKEKNAEIVYTVYMSHMEDLPKYNIPYPEKLVEKVKEAYNERKGRISLEKRSLSLNRE
jgi:hypothetical protein